jgi:hypothetical protein
VAKLASYDSFEGSSATLYELCGVFVCGRDVQRIAESIGAAIEARNKAKILDAFDPNSPKLQPAAAPIMYIEYDGTSIPAVKRDTENRKGKQADGTAKTREMKVGCIFTQSGLDKENRPVRDKGSTTYFAAIECAENFGRRLYAEAAARGSAQKTVVLGDGAKWIWGLADEHFPEATQIVDIFHAKEHLCMLLKSLLPDTPERAQLKENLYLILESGDIPLLIEELSALPTDNSEKAGSLSREIGYFRDNARRMNYATFKKSGLFVGSGVVEAACKNVIGKRLKQSGMRWSIDGANAIAALRCAILSHSFDSFWSHAATAA